MNARNLETKGGRGFVARARRSRLLGSAEKKTLKELLRIRLTGYKEAAKIAVEIGQTFVFGKKSSAETSSAGGIESEMEEARV